MNGIRVRRDWVTPRFIFMDPRGIPKAWTTYPNDTFSISCVLNDGPKSTFENVRICCDCLPPNEVESTAPSVPPSMSEPAAESIAATPSISATPSMSASPSNVITKADKREQGCVELDLRSLSDIGTWERVSGESRGLTFRPDDKSQSPRSPSVKNTVTVPFSPRKNGTHALVLDMTAKRSGTHNDVWIRMEGGLILRRHKMVMMQDESEFIRASVQNRGRSALLTGDVDGSNWWLSSAATLDKLRSYDVFIAGRTSMVVIHRLILFPCNETDCRRQSPEWMERFKVCTALL